MLSEGRNVTNSTIENDQSIDPSKVDILNILLHPANTDHNWK